jgi:pimeloyl-ACP methyl ester carboxylesterase
MNTFRTAELWVKLMRELGYSRFVAQGGDIGANVSSVMAWKHPESVLALHLNYIPGSYRPWVDEATQPLRPEEIVFQHKAQNWYDEKGGYWHVQATQPQTLGFAPIRLSAWQRGSSTSTATGPIAMAWWRGASAATSYSRTSASIGSPRRSHHLAACTWKAGGRRLCSIGLTSVSSHRRPCW